MLEACIREVKTWVCVNGLVLNESKSEANVIRSSSLRVPISFPRVDICGQHIAKSMIVHDLGVVTDADLAMTSQVANECRREYYHLSTKARIRESLMNSVYKYLVHALVTSRIDCDIATLFMV